MSIERFISQRAIEWFCSEVSEYPVDKVFNDIFESDGERFGKFLKDIGIKNKRQAMRFLELVERTDDIEKWLTFLEHEQKRERSAWKNNSVERFILKVREWVKNPDTGCVEMTNKKLREWHEHADVSISPAEENKLKIKALRTAFYVKLKGIV